MKMRDTIRRAGRSLRQAKARTLLTSLAIGVGAFTITLAFAAGAGGRAYAENIISSNTNVHEVYVQPKQNAQNDPMQPKEYTDDAVLSYGNGFSAKLLKQTDLDKIAKIDGVASVTPYYSVTIKYITRPNQKKYSVSAESFNASVKQEYVAGNGDALQKDEVILPQSFSTALGFAHPADAVGQTIQIAVDKGGSLPNAPETKLFEFKVAAVRKTSVLAVSAVNSLLLQKDAALELYNYSQQNTPLFGTYYGVAAIAKDDVKVASLKDRINKQGYDAQTAEDLMGFIFQFINVLQGILLGFGALAVLTSIFGIINTQYISVLERTQQIGLMKALGMRRRDVGRLFRYEAAWVGFLGGAIGAGMAVLAGVIANPFIRDALNLGATNLLIFTPVTVIGVIAGLMLVSVTAGMLPARKAAKLDPIEALRTD
jgi:putative ABC transport system permease protein